MTTAMTHRQARRKLGSRTTRRSGMKSQIIPGAAATNKGHRAEYRYPKRYPKVPRLCVRVRQLVAKSR